MAQPRDPLRDTQPAVEAGARGWATYERDELDTVLARFDIGRIDRAQEFRRGSRSAPKLKIWSSLGEFLLKRRSLERHPEVRIRFAHQLQATLARHGYPIAGLMPDRRTGETLVIIDGHAYELFHFVTGDRFDKTARATIRAAEMLARLHRHSRDIDASVLPPASFHASPAARAALDRLERSILAAEPGTDPERVARLVQELREIYGRAVEEIRDLGFASLRSAVVHGDWHPGNVIFTPRSDYRSIAAVIDFDSARNEPWVTEVANGMLQFAILSDAKLSPLEWDAGFDPKRLQAFLHGYLGAADRPLTLEERSMIPWLMIEAMVAESAIPVANQGTFAELQGSAFMDLVSRKCEWVRQHRKSISAL